jgi:hypothetical protein
MPHQICCVSVLPMHRKMNVHGLPGPPEGDCWEPRVRIDHRLTRGLVVREPPNVPPGSGNVRGAIVRARSPKINDGLPPHVDHWTDDHRIRALALRGEDCVGDLLIGQESFARFLSGSPVLTSPSDNPALAESSALQSSGSSAGGERPKFGAFSKGRHVLVKFAPPGDALAARRWRDLAWCEYRALRLLSEAGVAVAAAAAECRGEARLPGHLRALRPPPLDGHHHQPALQGLDEGLPRRPQRRGDRQAAHRAVRALRDGWKGVLLARASLTDSTLSGRQTFIRPPPSGARSRRRAARRREEVCLRATGRSPGPR